LYFIGCLKHTSVNFYTDLLLVISFWYLERNRIALVITVVMWLNKEKNVCRKGLIIFNFLLLAYYLNIERDRICKEIE